MLSQFVRDSATFFYFGLRFVLPFGRVRWNLESLLGSSTALGIASALGSRGGKRSRGSMPRLARSRYIVGYVGVRLPLSKSTSWTRLIPMCAAAPEPVGQPAAIRAARRIRPQVLRSGVGAERPSARV